MEGLKDKLITWLAGGFAFYLQTTSPGELMDIAEQINQVIEVAARQNLEAHLISLQRQEFIRTVGVLISLIVLFIVNWAALVLNFYNVRRNFYKVWPTWKAAFNDLWRKLWPKPSQWYWVKCLKKLGTKLICIFYKHW